MRNCFETKDQKEGIMIQITTLMDNELSANKALLCQHGLSFLVEQDNFRILFDCGPGEAMCRNAHRLGRDLVKLDGVVLSHSHYDHGAGYRDFLEQGGGSFISAGNKPSTVLPSGALTLYTGPHFFEPKYARNGFGFTDLSVGFDREFLEKHHVEHHVCQGREELAKGIWLVGDFPRQYEFEAIPDRFVRQVGERMIPDDFADEICLVLEMKEGLVILAGCSHPGILNMVEHIRRIFAKSVYAIFGGTHLKEADEERVRLTVDYLKWAGVRLLGLNHCSGTLVKERIARDFQVKSCFMRAGDCVFLE